MKHDKLMQFEHLLALNPNTEKSIIISSGCFCSLYPLPLTPTGVLKIRFLRGKVQIPAPLVCQIWSRSDLHLTFHVTSSNQHWPSYHSGTLFWSWKHTCEGHNAQRQSFISSSKVTTNYKKVTVFFWISSHSSKTCIFRWVWDSAEQRWELWLQQITPMLCFCFAQPLKQVNSLIISSSWLESWLDSPGSVAEQDR